MCWRQPNYCFGLVCFWLLEEKCVLARKQVGRALGADRTGLMKEGRAPKRNRGWHDRSTRCVQEGEKWAVATDRGLEARKEEQKRAEVQPNLPVVCWPWVVLAGEAFLQAPHALAKSRSLGGVPASHPEQLPHTTGVLSWGKSPK